MNVVWQDPPGVSSDPYAPLSSELRAVLADDGTLAGTGPSWVRLLGGGADTFDGVPLVDLAHLDDRTRVQDLLDVLGQGGEVLGLEVRLRRRDGDHRWVRCHARPHPGDALGYLLVQDVTEQRRDRAARELLEAESGVGTWELDLGSGRSYWSRVTHALFGTDPERDEVTIAASLERFPQPDRTRLATAFEALSTSGRPYDLELTFLAPDGTSRLVRTVGRAVLRDQLVIGVYGTMEDVTDRHERQREREELAATQALLEEAQRLAGLGHFSGDLDHAQMWWSPMMYEIMGVDPARELTAAERRALVHAEDRELIDGIRDRLRHEGKVTVDFRVRRQDGELRRLRQVTRLVVEGTGGSGRFLGTVQDLTELRAVEQALRESQERLERVLAATNDGWWDLQLDTGSSFYSDRWWELSGYRPEDLPPGSEPWRQITHPDDLPAFERGLAQALGAGERTFVLPSAGRHRDGRRIPMVVRGIVDYDDAGNPVRISGATSDVSEAHQAEVAKERFIATVSHELRTPLTAIGGALELLERGVSGELPSGAVTLVEVGQRNAHRLRLLIDDLLDLERLLTEHQPFELVAHDLERLLADAVADNQPYATAHGVRLVLASGVGTATVAVDVARVEQVLANLLSNAAKYAPEGTEVEVGLRSVPDVADRVRVEVVDHGPGVPSELVERVFERFVQADPVDPRSRGGTGLGLAISREIVERHGGRIGLDQGPGRTCFWFELPVERARG